MSVSEIKGVPQVEGWEEWMDWGVDQPKQEEEEEEDIHMTSARNSYSECGSSRDLPPLSPQSSKKRKLSSDSDNANLPKKPSSAPKKAVQDRSHSVVEKRYRENLNQKISDLRNCIPNLRKGDKDSRIGDLSGQKQNKATVLSEAMTYIRHLEQRNSFLEELNCTMKEQIHRGQSPRVGPTRSRNDQLVDPVKRTTAEREPDTSEGDTPPPKGLIPVPEEMRRLWNGRSEEHYADTASYQSEDSSGSSISTRGGRYVGRMVFGSLAGIMILDGFSDSPKRNEKRDERGLSAIPLPYLLPRTKRLVTWGISTTPTIYHVLSPLVKAFILFSLCGLMLFLYLYYSKPPIQKMGLNRPKFGQTNAPMSPLEVRRNAWLTSIQTVWVPRRHMLPEMLALVLETAAYLTRKLLGWDCYSWLTGRSEEEETARVRAWEIALDAQLSGGDPELSKSRLVLTLWASGTLPSTPAGLMLKALHIRVLFWQPSRLKTVCRVMHKAARNLARHQWRRAIKLQEMIEKNEGGQIPAEPLPDHLRVLLRESSDLILRDLVVQKAYNLAWDISNDDSVQASEFAKDSAMLGPLDKLALWHNTSPTPPKDTRTPENEKS